LDNKIWSFSQLGLTDPIRPVTTLETTFDIVESMEYDQPVYSQNFLTTKHVETSLAQAQRCIFLPDNKLLQRMIIALIKYADDPDEKFFLRFALPNEIAQ
jgi:hypothetical protein